MNQVYYWNRVCPTKFGTGASETIGDDAKAMGFSRVMLCTEQALMDFGIATKVQERLKDAGLEVFVYAACVPDAPSEVCDAGAAFARENNVDGIVAVGGGSTMDTAKAVGIILSMGGTTIADYYHIPEPEHKIRLIAIPTTSGTGSENSPGAVIRDAETGRKEIPVYKANLALVDPVLTYTVPASVTAATGLDVLAHAAEAITNRNFNAYGNIFAKEAIRLTMKYLKTACEKPDDVEAREKMAFASNLAGLAMAECGCSIGHTFSQTFAAMNHIPHGLGCAWALPSCMTYTARYGTREDLAETADAFGITVSDADDAEAIAKKIADILVAFMKELKVVSIKEKGYTLEDCLKATELFQYDAAYANAPGTPLSDDEIRAYIRETYEMYQ
ncbi:MAG: iron-containing alcohol dehydrogenase [Eubacterium sp.]|nr:iron-containing alcohol dehydrogenase [Eubacterium sp.]